MTHTKQVTYGTYIEYPTGLSPDWIVDFPATVIERKQFRCVAVFSTHHTHISLDWIVISSATVIECQQFRCVAVFFLGVLQCDFPATVIEGEQFRCVAVFSTHHTHTSPDWTVDSSATVMSEFNSGVLQCFFRCVAARCAAV